MKIGVSLRFITYINETSTSLAIVQSLNARLVDKFFYYANGYAGVICEIDSIDTDSLIEQLKRIFEIDYVDFEGVKHDNIVKIAIVAGGGDVANCMNEVELKGVQAYITGEIHCRIDNDYGRTRYGQIMDYAKNTNMSLIGVSHAASEFLVMKEPISHWFMDRYKVKVRLLNELKWWR